MEKPHLDVGLGIEAINKGYQVYFVTTGELFQLLKKEEFSHKSQVQMKRLRASDLIIIIYGDRSTGGHSVDQSSL